VVIVSSTCSADWFTISGARLLQEIDELSKLEDTTLSSDLSQGFALKALASQLLSSCNSCPLVLIFIDKLGCESFCLRHLIIIIIII